MADHWLTPIQVAKALGRDHEDTWLRGQLLAGLNSGDLRAKARVAIFSSGGLVERKTHWDISPAFWIERHAGPRLFLNLEQDLAVNGNGPSPSGEGVDILAIWNVQCRGLTFEQGDLAYLFDLPAPPQANMAPEPSSHGVRNIGGAPVKTEKWSAFASALAMWVYRKDLDAPAIAEVGPDELMAELQNIAQSEWNVSLARTTHRDAIDHFLERMKSEVNAGK